MFKRLLKPVWLLLAVLLVFEEWLWAALLCRLRHLSNLPPVRWLERQARRLPPWASLAVMLVPMLAMLPFKVAALWAMAHGHKAVGVLVLVAAKLTGSALGAYLFSLVGESARRIRWVNALHGWLLALLARTHAWLEQQAVYVALRARVAAWRRWLGDRRRTLHRRAPWRRRLQAAKSSVRNRMGS